MRHRFLAATLLLACAPFATSAPCWGQSADEATTTVARARFKEGVEFYDKGDFERARASFLQAYALKKHPAVLLNLAWSCLKSGHPLESERYFAQFPTDGKDITDKQRADAADGLAQARGKLGRIEVSAISGAELSADGERVGVAPLAEALLVEPGAHTLKARNADGTTEILSVTVLAGEKGVARFGGGPVAPAVAPMGAPAADTTPVATSEPPRAAVSHEASKPLPPTSSNDTSPSRSFFPANMLPVYVGGILTLAGAGVAIVMLEFKQDALDKANATADNIRAQGRACPPPAGPPVPGLASACSVLSNDNDQVNMDATLGNIAVGVAVAGLVGTATYWIIADKNENSSRTASRVAILPLVGRSTGGLSLSGNF
jgi:hypothetical protein